MDRKRKTILAFAAAVAALLVLSAIGIAVLFDIDAYRPKVEAAASDALGMEVRIRGGMRLALSPPFGVAMDDVRVRHREVDLLRAQRMRVGVRLLPLFRREIRIAELRLAGPSFDVRRRGTGRLDVERYVDGPLQRSRELLPGAFSRVARIVLTDGALAYSNAESGNRAVMEDVDVTLRDLSLGDRPGFEPLKSLSFTGNVDIGRVEASGFAATGVKTEVKAADGAFVFDPVSMTVFGATATGSFRAEAAGGGAVVAVKCAVPTFRIERALEAFSQEEILRGETAFSADLSMKGETLGEMTETLSGEVSLRGADLALPYDDLDRTVAHSGGRGDATLAGAAALLLPGSPGAALALGQESPAGVVGPGSGTAVRDFVSDWQVANGVAHARDAALATGENRIALQGALDLGGGRFEELTVALLDPRGCAVVSREIGGTFREPEVGKTRRRKAPTGPAPPSQPEAGNAAAGEECKVFYSGAVAPAGASNPGDG